MARAQHDPIPAATDVEDPEPSTPPAGQRRRMLPIYAAVCLACLLAALAHAGSNARSRAIELGGRVGLSTVHEKPRNHTTPITLWVVVKTCEMIEELQVQIDEAKGEANAELKPRLAALKRDVPDCEEITSAYNATDSWDDIKSMARLEELEYLADAESSGSEKLKNLQKELERAHAAVPPVDHVRQETSAVWQNRGNIPGKHIQASGDKLEEDIHESVSGLVDTASGSVDKWF